MWLFPAFFCVIYFFWGIAPIVYYAWYSHWWLFWLYLAYWVVNIVVLEYVKKQNW